MSSPLKLDAEEVKLLRDFERGNSKASTTSTKRRENWQKRYTASFGRTDESTFGSRHAIRPERGRVRSLRVSAVR